MNTKLLAITLAAFCLSGTAVAAEEQTTEGTSRSETTFKALDSNTDGYIDTKEARNNVQLNQNFEQIDIDDDSKISEREFMGATGGSQDTDRNMMDGVPGSGVDDEMTE